MTLSADEVDQLQSLNDPVGLEEVIAIYLPLSRLLSLYVAATQGLFKATQRFLLAEAEVKVPYVIGVAGSVAVGKSTTARVLQALGAGSVAAAANPRDAIQALKAFANPVDVIITDLQFPGMDALELIRRHRPDVAIVDIEMPQVDGFAVVRAVRDEGLATRLIVLTMHKDEVMLREAIEMGIDAGIRASR